MQKAKVYFTAVIMLIIVIVGCCLSGCINIPAKIKADDNTYDDVYELSDGRYIVVENDAIALTSSLRTKDNQIIEGVEPLVRELNPQILGDYLYISQDISTEETTKTRVTKINKDTLELVKEKEYDFSFDCMTINGEELIYAGCVNAQNQKVCCIINTDLEERYIESNLQTLDSNDRNVIDVDKIYYMQFSGNKGVMITEKDINFYEYCLLCTVIIEDEQLKVCKSFYILEPNAQILYTDYDKVLNFVYNSDGTDPMVLMMNSQMKFVEVNSDSLFETKAIPQNTINLNIEDYRMEGEKEKIIRIRGNGVGEYRYKEDGFGKFIQTDKWFYYVYIGRETIQIEKINQDNLEVKNYTRIAHFEVEREIDIKSLKSRIIKTDDDSIYFHLSDKDGYIASGFVDIGGIWL